MGGCLLPTHVVEIIGHDQRQVQVGSETEQLLVEPALLGQAMVLELQEEPALSEDVRVLAADAPREIPVLDLECP